MGYRVPKIINKSFVKYAFESATELDELRKLKIIAVSGEYTKRKLTISVEKPTVIEIRVYDLSNFSKNVYNDFNKKIKKLFQ